MKTSPIAVYLSLYRYILFVSLTLISIKLIAQVPATPGSQALESGQVSMRNWVDRTALFPGDSLMYQIEINVDANMGILLDDLGSDELGLTGLELISSDIDEDVSENGTTYHASYQLATFETGTATLDIDELTVRYFFRRPGQRLENVAVAGEIYIPAVSLALQSTLPANPASLGLRDLGRLSDLQGQMRGTGTLGLVLFLVSVIPLIFLIRSRINKTEPLQDNHKYDEMLEETSAELLKLKNLDPDVPEQRLDGFNQLEHLVKEFIENTMGIRTAPLTSVELSGRAADINPLLTASDLAALLENCETARYGKSEDLPSSDNFNKGLMLVQDLLKG